MYFAMTIQADTEFIDSAMQIEANKNYAFTVNGKLQPSSNLENVNDVLRIHYTFKKSDFVELFQITTADLVTGLNYFSATEEIRNRVAVFKTLEYFS